MTLPERLQVLRSLTTSSVAAQLVEQARRVDLAQAAAHSAPPVQGASAAPAAPTETEAVAQPALKARLTRVRRHGVPPLDRRVVTLLARRQFSCWVAPAAVLVEATVHQASPAAEAEAEPGCGSVRKR